MKFKYIIFKKVNKCWKPIKLKTELRLYDWETYMLGQLYTSKYILYRNHKKHEYLTEAELIKKHYDKLIGL
jgi:hypothetical protein